MTPRMFKARLRKPRVSVNFDFRYESKFSLINLVYILTIRCSKNDKENYTKKGF